MVVDGKYKGPATILMERTCDVKKGNGDLQLLVEQSKGSMTPVTLRKGNQGFISTAQYIYTNSPVDLLADRAGEEAKQGKRGKKATSLYTPFQRSLWNSFNMARRLPVVSVLSGHHSATLHPTASNIDLTSTWTALLLV